MKSLKKKKKEKEMQLLNNVLPWTVCMALYCMYDCMCLFFFLCEISNSFFFFFLFFSATVVTHVYCFNWCSVTTHLCAAKEQNESDMFQNKSQRIFHLYNTCKLIFYIFSKKKNSYRKIFKENFLNKRIKKGKVWHSRLVRNSGMLPVY